MIQITHTCQQCGASIIEEKCPYCGSRNSNYCGSSTPLRERDIRIKKVPFGTGYYDYANNEFVIAPSKELFTFENCIVVLVDGGFCVYNKEEYAVIQAVEGAKDRYKMPGTDTICVAFDNKTDVYAASATSRGLTLRASIPENSRIEWEYRNRLFCMGDKGLYNKHGKKILTGYIGRRGAFGNYFIVSDKNRKNFGIFNAISETMVVPMIYPEIAYKDAFGDYIILSGKDGVGIFNANTETFIVPMKYPAISYNPQYNRMEIGDKEEEKTLRDTINGLRKTDLLIWSICIVLIAIGFIANFAIMCVSLGIVSLLLILPIFGIKIFKS